MKLITGPKKLHVVLSRRNLLTLLAKLYEPDSACSIFALQADGTILIVRSEPDLVHYANRAAPGAISPITERIIRDL